MKKKTLLILLIIPFIISLLTFVSIQILDNSVASDILGISWKYDENEGFQIDPENGYLLEAEPIVDPNLILANGNTLTWKADEDQDEENPIARIDEVNGKFYLYALNEGQVEITCQNVRGTVSRHFLATVFEDGAMVINPVRKGSGKSITQIKHYGLYDLSYNSLQKDNYTKKNAIVEISTLSYLDGGGKSTKNRLVDKSDNVTYRDNIITLEGLGEAYVTLEEPDHNYRATYSFVIEDGVNVYKYGDLLMATNFSSTGETICLQTNLESLKNVYKTDTNTGNYLNDKLDTVKESNNTELFGHCIDLSNQTFTFDSEYYTFDTTYDSTYIDWYNENEENIKNNKSISKKVKAGIHLQKDLYGNGYSINMNNLAFPNHGSYSSDGKGKLTPDPTLDYFHGPLPFLSVGDYTTMPLIVALGQDNCGVYVDKDGVTIDDVYLSNTDNLNNFYDFTYTGSVLDIKAENVTVQNSVISNGKVALRAYDAENLLVDNCILRNAGEFTMLVGSDQKNGYDTQRQVKETFDDGTVIDTTFNDFFDTLGGERTDTADYRLNQFVQATINGTVNEYDYVGEIQTIQDYLDNKNHTAYNAHIRVKDTLFGRSGVFSIASESMFNGALLYGGIPSMIYSFLSMVGELPAKVGGTSSPVSLTLEGDTRFYDWKTITSIDVSSLIEENISSMLASLGFGDKEVTIDDIFPMKNALRKQARSKNLIHNGDYINTAIAYYGGGLNVSKIDPGSDTSYNTYSDEFEVDLMDEITSSTDSGLSAMMIDAVVLTIGSHPFRFITNSSKEASSTLLPLESAPSVDTLKGHYKGGNL